MNSITELDQSISTMLELAYKSDSEDRSFRSARYALWNLTRLGWSDDDILEKAPHYYANLVREMNKL